ncbi:MAG TPA: class I SAM-dependent methyltransferase [Syntrophales bacterium]|jgi:methylase of polypeptide subunit release factors|nr:class I SAM-dependent methyltransferase [Syntrophales bacterium]HPC32612.1 class I SAM-dependent methyltransferase [Syntrophales bacterium]HQG34191.1 class I SAM-dependent methyltransferase [Syntrophales bacterium]HRR47178.1 class I SAM-dependent methyltransferase [Syntrophales bacterium]
MRIQLPAGTIELSIPRDVHEPAPSSLELARLLDVRPGDAVLDLGCGSGLLAITAAVSGARRVVATDVAAGALAATRENARRNGVAELVEIRAGSWFAAVVPGERFEVIVATPPQTPGPRPEGPRYGGWDGADHLVSIAAAAPAYLTPRQGRLWLLAISLANPARLRQELTDRFRDVRIVRETERVFTAVEFEARQAGLMDHLLTLRAAGRSFFTNDAAGRYRFRNLFFRAARPDAASASPGTPGRVIADGRDAAAGKS